MLRRTKLFRRLPTLPLFWRPKEEQIFIKSNDQGKYPLLVDDFALLELELMPVYRELDNRALEMQNRFRFYQVLQIIGGVLTSVLGIVLIVVIKETVIATLIGASEAILAGVLAVLARVGNKSNAQNLYFSNRLAAEVLHGEYFLFLGRLGSYADDRNRKRNLRLRLAEVEDIARGKKV